MVSVFFPRSVMHSTGKQPFRVGVERPRGVSEGRPETDFRIRECSRRLNAESAEQLMQSVPVTNCDHDK